MMIEKVMIQIGATSQKIAGGLGGGGGGAAAPPTMIEQVMIQLGPKKYKKAAGGHQFLCARPHGTSEDSITGKLIPVKRQPRNLKSSCRMMIEKVMIQIGATSPKNSGGVGRGGGAAAPPTMIEKVMIH